MSFPAQPGTGISGGSLVDLLRARAAADPGHIAHMFSADGESWDASLTYGQLDQAARAVAVRLLEEAAPGDRALLLYRYPDRAEKPKGDGVVLEGAEAIRKLRALIATGDFEEYWRFHLCREHERVHQAKYRDSHVIAA